MNVLNSKLVIPKYVHTSHHHQLLNLGNFIKNPATKALADFFPLPSFMIHTFETMRVPTSLAEYLFA